MLHSVIITNSQGILLLSQYFGGGCEAWDAEGASARASWERRLWAIGSPWVNQGQGSQIKEPVDGVNMIDQWTVVWCSYGDFIIFLSGNDEYDELILANEILPIVCALLNEHCEKKLTENVLLRGDIYGKVTISLEEMVRDGHLFHTSLDAILKMSKMRKSTPTT
mmetsp:Transcript_4476/g.5825  ORF Transcript_4476/g.5825 Transcript_4476/m.5825 type:complete len:165 (+) Transcript_4476:61-555(+)